MTTVIVGLILFVFGIVLFYRNEAVYTFRMRCLTLGLLPKASYFRMLFQVWTRVEDFMDKNKASFSKPNNIYSTLFLARKVSIRIKRTY